MNITVDLEPGTDAFEAVCQRVAEIIRADEPTPSGAEKFLRGADAIADYLGCSVWRVYRLRTHDRGFPADKEGRDLIALPSALAAWIAAGGGKTGMTTSSLSTTPRRDT